MQFGELAKIMCVMGFVACSSSKTTSPEKKRPPANSPGQGFHPEKCPKLLTGGNIKSLPPNKLIKIALPKNLVFTQIFPKGDGFYAIDAKGHAYSWGSSPHEDCEKSGSGLRRHHYMGENIVSIMNIFGDLVAKKPAERYFAYQMRRFGDPHERITPQPPYRRNPKKRTIKKGLYLRTLPLTGHIPPLLWGDTLRHYFYSRAGKDHRYGTLDSTGTVLLLSRKAITTPWVTKTPAALKNTRFSSLIWNTKYLLLLTKSGQLHTYSELGRAQPDRTDDTGPMRQRCFDSLLATGTYMRNEIQKLVDDRKKFISKEAIRRERAQFDTLRTMQQEFASRLRKLRRLDEVGRSLKIRIDALEKELKTASKKRFESSRNYFKGVRKVMDEVRRRRQPECSNYSLPLGPTLHRVNLRDNPETASITQWGKTACAISKDARLYCFNLDCHVQFSAPPIGNSKNLRFRSVHIGMERVCAETRTGQVICFKRGHLGYDFPPNSPRTRSCTLPLKPLDYAHTTFAAPKAGIATLIMQPGNLCILDRKGQVWCRRWQ